MGIELSHCGSQAWLLRHVAIVPKWNAALLPTLQFLRDSCAQHKVKYRKYAWNRLDETEGALIERKIRREDRKGKQKIFFSLDQMFDDRPRFAKLEQRIPTVKRNESRVETGDLQSKDGSPGTLRPLNGKSFAPEQSISRHTELETTSRNTTIQFYATLPSSERIQSGWFKRKSLTLITLSLSSES